MCAAELSHPAESQSPEELSSKALATVNIVSRLPELARSRPDLLAASIQRVGKFSRLFGRYQYQYDEMTFAQLESLSNDAARGLKLQGIGVGVKTVLMVTPSIEFFVLTFALMKVGAIPVLIDPGMGIKNLKDCIDEVGAEAFIGVLKAQVARVILGWGKGSIRSVVTVSSSPIRSVFSGIDYQRLLILGEAARANGDNSFSIVHSSANDLAGILFTSGSTGAPKGVEYTQGMFAEQVRILRDVYQIDTGERDLATFPLFSLFGPALGMASIVPFMDASKPITANPEHLISVIKKYSCTNMFVSPALIEKIGQYAENYRGRVDLGSVRRVISAGAPARHESLQRFRQLLSSNAELLPSYGATESLPVSKIEGGELMETQAQTEQGAGVCVGYPVNGVTVKIVRLDDDDIPYWDDQLELKPGEIGEIAVRGAVVSRHYFQRPKAEAAAKIQIKGVDGFYHRMGDLGYFDELGRLWMCGRKGHRVNTVDGELYTLPCERIFDTHAMVKRSALVGVYQNGCESLMPVICIELDPAFKRINKKLLRTELLTLAKTHELTSTIDVILFHPKFPLDVRHNAKIFREKLALWAEENVQSEINISNEENNGRRQA